MSEQELNQVKTQEPNQVGSSPTQELTQVESSPTQELTQVQVKNLTHQG